MLYLARLRELTARLSWDRDRILHHQRTGLRALLRRALASPWQCSRLGGLDPDRFELGDLGGLPTMRKSDVLERFDELVAPLPLSRRHVERHLARARPGEPLVGGYQVVTSGGTSGAQSIYVYDPGSWAECAAGFVRSLGQHDRPAVVAAGHGAHMSATLWKTFGGGDGLDVPVSLPLETIAEALTGFRPDLVIGFPSALARLARRSDCRIAPRTVVATSEPLDPDTARQVERAWGCIPHDWWGCSEVGPLAASCGQGPGMHLNEDLAVVEPVDRLGHPVAEGEQAHRVLVTGLYNRVLPLIRYELDDAVVLDPHPCPCGRAYRRVARVEGRRDEVLRYGPREIHPHVLRSPLARPGVYDYQVRQTARGVSVHVTGDAGLNLQSLRCDILEALARAGLPCPEVEVAFGEGLRLPSGKLRRFIPLPPDHYDCGAEGRFGHSSPPR
ncbi:MAG: hypothetical protein AB1758_25475 [Candidatus Eremiobacterota bacterium]